MTKKISRKEKEGKTPEQLIHEELNKFYEKWGDVDGEYNREVNNVKKH